MTARAGLIVWVGGPWDYSGLAAVPQAYAAAGAAGPSHYRYFGSQGSTKSVRPHQSATTATASNSQVIPFTKRDTFIHRIDQPNSLEKLAAHVHDFDLRADNSKVNETLRIDRCNNIGDFRTMARRRLPGPIFHYIDGAADDEVTYRRNTEAYERCDLVPNVLAGVESIDMSTTVMGQKLDMPLFCSPTALQRLFHHDGERAVAKAAEKFGTMFGISSLATISIEEIGSTISTPKLFQLYFHKDRGLTNSMIERCIAAKFDVLALTVDTITGGNRERDLRTGFTSPPRLTLKRRSRSCTPRSAS